MRRRTFLLAGLAAGAAGLTGALSGCVLFEESHPVVTAAGRTKLRATKAAIAGPEGSRRANLFYLDGSGRLMVAELTDGHPGEPTRLLPDVDDLVDFSVHQEAADFTLVAVAKNGNPYAVGSLPGVDTGSLGARVPGVRDIGACFAGPDLAYFVEWGSGVEVLGRANDYYCLGVRADPGQVIEPTYLPGLGSPTVIANDGVSGFAVSGDVLMGWGANNHRRLSADPSVTGFWEPQVLDMPQPLDLDTGFAWHTATVAINPAGRLIGWGAQAGDVPVDGATADEAPIDAPGELAAPVPLTRARAYDGVVAALGNDGVVYATSPTGDRAHEFVAWDWIGAPVIELGRGRQFVALLD